MDQATEAPQQRQQQRLSTAAVLVLDQDAAQSTQPGTAEQVVDVLDGTEAVHQLDRELLDVTQRVVQAKSASAPEGCLARAVGLELERVRFKKEAKRRYRRACALSPNYKRKRRRD